MHPSYKITLADGFSLQITAGDAKAAPVVELLARAMRLGPGEAETVLRVITAEAESLFLKRDKEILCRLLPPAGPDDVAHRVFQVSLAIAHMVQKRGGILVHGGLAEFQGQGIILAAPSDTGKTTASSRLPAPWRSLSDDMALIVRATDHCYYGHPWPTWSLFFPKGPGGSWNTEYGVPLKSLVFLSQSQKDDLEDLNASQAAAMLIESVEQANTTFKRDLSSEDIHHNHMEQFAIVCAVTACLPSFRLLLSLNGKFWTHLEESLRRPAQPGLLSSAERKQGSVSGQIKPIAPGVVIAGHSMYPTLAGPGYVDVRPYGNEKPRRGDVIHFRSPATGTMVIHRVMEVRPEGLVTRGDANSNNDPDYVSYSDVEGKVVAVRDTRGRRPVRGGRAGMKDYAFVRLFRRTRMIAGRMVQWFSFIRLLTDGLRCILPERMDWKIVFFGHPLRGHLKIMAKGVCVGCYERDVWRIAYPWRLHVDMAKLDAAVKKMEFIKEQWIIQSLAEKGV